MRNVPNWECIEENETVRWQLESDNKVEVIVSPRDKNTKGSPLVIILKIEDDGSGRPSGEVELPFQYDREDRDEAIEWALWAMENHFSNYQKAEEKLKDLKG